MATVTLKGNTFSVPSIRDSFTRRAVSYQNKILATLAQIGLGENDSDIPLNPASFKKVPASASWYYDGKHCHYSCKTQKNFVENLFVVMKVIELEVEKLLAKSITSDEFIALFSEEEDVEKKRAAARELLGVDKEELDLEVINKQYKNLAKSAHPDMGGDLEHFKALNNAHKLLKKELL